VKVEKNQVEVYKIPRLEKPPLIACWQVHDVGKLGSKAIDFLIEKLGGQEIAEMNPLGFFSLGGARFKDDLVQILESKFWACEDHNLLVFKSDEPAFEQHRFLSLLLDFAEHNFQIRECYTLNGVLSFVAHTLPRKILAVFTQPEFYERLQIYGLEGMTWEGPPALSSYLLWLAKRRGIAGVSLWPQIPFYLATRQDPQAIKQALSFLDKRFNLGLDLGVFDSEIKYQNEKIARLREEDAEIEGYIKRLESGSSLDEEEQVALVRAIHELFARGD
jgi:proteasome assembly chaperone (PAC2) family protein